MIEPEGDEVIDEVLSGLGDLDPNGVPSRALHAESPLGFGGEEGFAL